MSTFAQRLAEQRVNIGEQAKALLDRAADENRDLSAEEQVSYDKMNADIDAIAARVKTLVDQEKRDAEMDAAFGRLNTERHEAPKVRSADSGLRGFLRGETRSFEVKPEQRADELTLTTSAGAVPSGFYPTLWEHMVEHSGILQCRPTILNTASGETIKVPKTTAHSTAAAQTEITAITASDPTITSVDLTVAKQGYLLQISKELVEDAGFDLEGYVARNAGWALSDRVGAVAATALLDTITAGVTAGNAIGAVTSFGTQSTEGEGFDFLISLYHSVVSGYRTNASWLMSDTAAATLRKLKSADGVYAWQASNIAGQPDTVLGKPVYTDPNIAVPAASAKSVIFGDFSALYVRVAGGVRFERSDDFAFDQDMTTFRALVRTGAKRVDDGALKAFVHAAS